MRLIPPLPFKLPLMTIESLGYARRIHDARRADRDATRKDTAHRREADVGVPRYGDPGRGGEVGESVGARAGAVKQCAALQRKSAVGRVHRPTIEIEVAAERELPVGQGIGGGIVWRPGAAAKIHVGAGANTDRAIKFAPFEAKLLPVPLVDSPLPK